MLNKSLVFLNQCFKSLEANRLRFALTIFGVASGILIYLVGMIAVDSFNEQEKARLSHFDPNSVLVQGEFSREIIKNMKLRLQGDHYVPYTNATVYKLHDIEVKGARGDVVARFVGTTSSFYKSPIPATNSDMLNQTKLIKGRDFNHSEISEHKTVAIISEYSARILFGNNDCIGKFIEISIPRELGKIDLYKFEVIGVIKDTYQINQERTANFMNIKNQSAKPAAEQEPYSIELDVYVPYTSMQILHPDQETTQSEVNVQEKRIEQTFAKMVFSYPKNDFVNKSHELKTFFSQDNYQSLITRNDLEKMVEEDTNESKGFLNVILGLILFVSGVNIFNTTVFSVKERIQEIGIRKVVGASNLQIALQFLVESIIVSLAGVLIATAIALVICLIVYYYLTNVLLLDYYIVIKPTTILVAVFIAVLQGIVFSSIPVLLATRTKIVNALRFD